jgi:hypothetical protein
MLSKTEMSVGIAHKMYECRKAVKGLWSNEYRVKISTYVMALKKVMDEYGYNELQAVLKFMEDPEIKSNEMAVMLFMAAAIEISEEI